MSDEPPTKFFALLQEFRLTVSPIGRCALVLWHEPCKRNVRDDLPPGVGVGVVFSEAREHYYRCEEAGE
jgi:hypothetical protein